MRQSWLTLPGVTPNVEIGSLRGTAGSMGVYRQTRKLIKAKGERIVSLALVPIFLLGMLPRTACICADGHREAMCPAIRHAVAARSAASASSGKSCCQKREAKQPARCCANKFAQRENDHFPLKVIGPKTGSCCQPVLEAPLVAVVEKKVGVSERSICVATSDSAESYVGVVALWPAFNAVGLCTPPPLDAVIVFSRLTI